MTFFPEARLRISGSLPEPEEGDPLDEIDLEPQSVAETKLSIKELRLRKKELQGRKREIGAELAGVRASWRERQAGRYSTVALGRGTSGRIMHGMVQDKRRGERMERAEVVNRFTDAKQEIDDQILEVDRAIIDLERYVLQAGK